MKESVYFVSDLHLGLQEPLEEERKLRAFARLADMAVSDGAALYMLGDVLDYWMEFRNVVPKGFTRFFCILRRLVDAGVEVRWLAGNHDFYLGSFIERELGVGTGYGMEEVEHGGRRFLIAHGDGLGEGDLGYKLFARFARNRFNLGLLTLFHADLATGLMRWLSRLSRDHKPVNLSYENDRLLNFARSLATERDFDYFLCGHNHVLGEHELPGGRSRYVNLGSWIDGSTPYAVYREGSLRLLDLQP
ncbi:UDP-2,3-diacylglucosamine diphosphatase [Chlorobium sp. N1]|nr:UDP-2,3-diacylglucosamine diphosphatase [Chlorobium sp. N1]